MPDSFFIPNLRDTAGIHWRCQTSSTLSWRLFQRVLNTNGKKGLETIGYFNDPWWFWWAPRYGLTATTLSGWRFCQAANAGLCGDIDEAAGADVFQAALFEGGLVEHMARWRVVGGRVPCWLMVAEMSDNSSAEPRCQLTGQTLWRSERCLLRYGEKKKKAIKALRLTFHIASGSLSSRRRVPIRCFHLNISGEAANLSKSITWSRGRSSFAAKLPVCFAEVRISSADPAVVIQAEHLESLSQTASPCDVVS